MKNLISTIAIVLILILCAVINAQGQTIKPVKIPYLAFKQRHLRMIDVTAETFYHYDTVKIVTIVSHGKALIMTSRRAQNISSELKDELVNSVMKQCPTVIKNNYIADYIYSHSK